MVACPAKHPLHPTSNCYKKAIVRACCDRLREIEGRLEQSVGPRFEPQLQSCDDLCGVARLILMLQRRTELREAESGWLEELAQLSPAELDENPPKLALQLRRRLEDRDRHRARARARARPGLGLGRGIGIGVRVRVRARARARAGCAQAAGGAARVCAARGGAVFTDRRDGAAPARQHGARHLDARHLGARRAQG